MSFCPLRISKFGAQTENEYNSFDECKKQFYDRILIRPYICDL